MASKTTKTTKPAASTQETSTVNRWTQTRPLSFSDVPEIHRALWRLREDLEWEHTALMHDPWWMHHPRPPTFRDIRWVGDKLQIRCSWLEGFPGMPLREDTEPSS